MYWWTRPARLGKERDMVADITPPAERDLPPGRLHALRERLVLELAAASPRRSHRRRTRIALAPAVVAAATLALLLVAPWESRGPSVVDRALAAVGAGPVVHAVVEFSGPEDVVVDLATGAERERVHRTEYWYDEQRRQLRVRWTTDGGEPMDYGGSVDITKLDPALAGFATQYRDALADGRARVAGDAIVQGRRVRRIEFAPSSSGAVEEVTVDAETSVPVGFHTTYAGGRRSHEWRVVAIESVPRDPSDFTPAEPARPRPTTGEVSEGRPITLAEAARVLGRSPLWLGPSFAGRELESVELAHSRAWLTDGSMVRGEHVRLAYGRVRVSLASDASGSYAIGFGDVEYPTPPVGSVAISGSDRQGWHGELRRGDFAVMLSAARKEQVLFAARALTPVP
jgi:hypothetical protein